MPRPNGPRLDGLGDEGNGPARWRSDGWGVLDRLDIRRGWLVRSCSCGSGRRRETGDGLRDVQLISRRARESCSGRGAVGAVGAVLILSQTGRDKRRALHGPRRTTSRPDSRAMRGVQRTTPWRRAPGHGDRRRGCGRPGRLDGRNPVSHRPRTLTAQDRSNARENGCAGETSSRRDAVDPVQPAVAGTRPANQPVGVRNKYR